MCSVYRAAVREHLPNAALVVDHFHFHVVQLANQMVASVRRRVTSALRGRRVRKDDPEYGIRRRLLRNREDLTDEKFTDMWNRLIDLGQPGQDILSAWIAKEELRALLALARTHPTRHQISTRLWALYRWCADTAIPELHRLAATIEAWWPQIEAFILTGITNAASEGINRLIKLEARNAFGFRNPINPTPPITLCEHLRACSISSGEGRESAGVGSADGRLNGGCSTPSSTTPMFLCGGPRTSPMSLDDLWPRSWPRTGVFSGLCCPAQYPLGAHRPVEPRMWVPVRRLRIR